MVAPVTIADSVSTQLRLCELFRSLQGEGPNAGRPATFLRLGGCNLKCGFCDSRYAWDPADSVGGFHQRPHDLREVVEAILATRPVRLVITGGEPLLQQGALDCMLTQLPDQLPLEIETNGTIRPSATLIQRVEQWNVSPKLHNSGVPRQHRLRFDALMALRGTERAWLKLVVADPSDVSEADALIEELEWPQRRVMWMPQADSAETLAERGPWVAEVALERNHCFSTRLQILLWGNQRGR